MNKFKKISKDQFFRDFAEYLIQEKIDGANVAIRYDAESDCIVTQSHDIYFRGE